MMKSLLKIVSISGFLLALPILVLAAPGIPHQFYGTVSFESGATPDGLLVEVKTGGAVVGSATTAGGKYGYMPSLLFASKTEGEWSGETATFFVGGIDTGESFALSKGGYTNLNLTVPGSATTPTPTPSPSPPPTGGGGGGGGGGGFTSTPITTPGPLSAAAQKVDANKDNKIDVLDFNTLMVNWGSTSANNVADFNGDGKVDVFDFNLLMINWTL